MTSNDHNPAGPDIQLADIFAAARRIEGIAHKTRLRFACDLSQRLSASVWLKMENTQDTGAFKIRGAANKILSLGEEERRRGVITVSSGNHGRATAYVARRLGVRAVVCMTDIAPAHKVEGVRAIGGEVVIHGSDQDEADLKAQELAERDGLTFISAFDDPHVIAGQGTLAVEMLTAEPGLDTLVVPLSGGGLMSGVAVAAKAINPAIRLIGVSTDHGAAMAESIRAGRIVGVDEKPSLADALPGPIPPDNRHTFAICRSLVDDIVQLSEEDIGGAMAYMQHYERVMLEGAGAAGVGALLARPDIATGANIGVVCSGANIDPARFADIAERYKEAFAAPPG